MLSPILTALTIIATASVVGAMPTEQAKRAPEASPNITVCTGFVPDNKGCISIPVVSGACVDFTGGLTFLNKEVSGVQVPGGFACTFGTDFGCNVGQGQGVSLTSGVWNMFNVPGTNGNIDFNDKASSFTCTPV